FYRPPSVPFRWASMATVVASAVLLIFVASNLFTSLTEEDALEENGIAKEADVLAPKEVEAKGQQDQEGDLATPPPGRVQGQVAAPTQILFTNVNIFDGISDSLTSGNVLVKDNLISEISTERIAGTPDMLVIDGGGRTLMPGLIDSHVHFNGYGGAIENPEEAQIADWELIAAQATFNARDLFMDGFTTVRDAGGNSDALRVLIDKGVLVGPRFYPSGPIICPTSGHCDSRAPAQRVPGAAPSWAEMLGLMAIADSPDEVSAAARFSLSKGATQIKLIASGGIASSLDPLWTLQYTQAELEAAVAAAERFDTYVFVHAYTDESIRVSIDAGVKSIEHGQMMSDETMKLLVDKGVYYTPDLTGLDPAIFTIPRYGSPRIRPKVEFFQEGSKDLVELIKKHKPKINFNAVAVGLGTQEARATRDLELDLFSKWFGNHALLVAITSTPGEMAQLTGLRNPYPAGKLGVIEEGAYADILVVDGNPLEDASVLGASDRFYTGEERGEGHDTMRVIMKDGVIYKNTIP
ncbi:MAG: amidohydrolase family protein, partial [Candidatus Binatia bacterium]